MIEPRSISTKPLTKLEEKLREARHQAAAGQAPERHHAESLPRIVATAIEPIESLVQEHQVDREAFILSIAQIEVRPQARKRFDDINSLARSIQEQGLLQPIVVRQLTSQRFLLLAGERRLRAVRDVLQQATIPARVIVKAEDGQRWRISQLTENLQRADYAPLELAREFKALKDEFGFSDANLAETLSVNPSWVWKQLSLLDAPSEIQIAIERGDIAATDYLNNKAHYLAQVSDASTGTNSRSAAATVAAVMKPLKRDAALSLPKKTAVELAELLQLLTAQYQLSPITLSNNPTKKELLAILTTRTSDIKQRL